MKISCLFFYEPLLIIVVCCMFDVCPVGAPCGYKFYSILFFQACALHNQQEHSCSHWHLPHPEGPGACYVRHNVLQARYHATEQSRVLQGFKACHQVSDLNSCKYPPEL